MQRITGLLPGNNCGECGYRNCREFAEALLGGEAITRCSFLRQERYQDNAARIAELLPHIEKETEVIEGVIDGKMADFALAPLAGEPSCREDLHPFDHTITLSPGDILRYRPLGCPITHFARVLEYNHGIITVHMTGPLHLLGEQEFQYKDLGICMVAAFEGMVSRGRVPDVGETVRFLPEHCMMQKVHSGVVVHSEGRRVRIEGIDLKVW